jgi:O-antigen/teichoic acid export membrane protein
VNIATGALWLLSTTALNQVWLLATLPLLARFYSPREFGIYAVFQTSHILASSFAGLRYESAAVVPKVDRTALACLSLAVLAGVATAILILSATLVASALNIRAFVENDLMFIGTSLAIAAFIGSLQRSAIAWATRKSRFNQIALMSTAINVLTILLQLSAALIIGSGASSLIGGFVLSLSAVTIIVVCRMTLAASRAGIRRPGMLRMRAAARRYKRFPTYMLVYGLTTSLRERLVQLLIAVYGGAALVGEFAMASRFSAAPNSLVYSALSPVIFSHAARSSSSATLSVVKIMFEVMLVVLVPVFAIFSSEAYAIVAELLGVRWLGVARIAVILAPSMLALTSISWMDRIFDVHSRQRLVLWMQIAYTAILCSLMTATMAADHQVAALYIFSVISTLYFAIFGSVAMKIVGAKSWSAVRPLIASLLAYAALFESSRLLQGHLSLAWRCFAYLATYLVWLGVYFFGMKRIKYIRNTLSGASE